MKQRYSLKKLIFYISILFTVIIPIIIVFLTTLNVYNTKVDTLEYNQKQRLEQVSSEANEFLDKIDKLSTYMQLNYKDNNSIIKSMVDLNDNITSIIILNKVGKIIDFYARENINIYKGFDYSNKQYFKEISRGKERYWSDLFLSTINETQSISYSFKIKDKVGVVFIKLTDLSNFINRLKNSDNSHMIRIYDNNGILLLDPDKPYLQTQRVDAKTQSVFIDLINKVKGKSLTEFTLTEKGYERARILISPIKTFFISNWKYITPMMLTFILILIAIVRLTICK